MALKSVNSMRNLRWLEHRHRLLSAAIAYVEGQREDHSEETRQFLAWAELELEEVERFLDAAEGKPQDVRPRQRRPA
jgi:hypothetical protein